LNGDGAHGAGQQYVPAKLALSPAPSQAPPATFGLCRFAKRAATSAVVATTIVVVNLRNIDNQQLVFCRAGWDVPGILFLALPVWPK
jgi:hypothetical protein